MQSSRPTLLYSALLYHRYCNYSGYHESERGEDCCHKDSLTKAWQISVNVASERQEILCAPNRLGSLWRTFVLCFSTENPASPGASQTGPHSLRNWLRRIG